MQCNIDPVSFVDDLNITFYIEPRISVVIKKKRGDRLKPCPQATLKTNSNDSNARYARVVYKFESSSQNSLNNFKKIKNNLVKRLLALNREEPGALRLERLERALRARSL
jgi:hypothetical protein